MSLNVERLTEPVPVDGGLVQGYTDEKSEVRHYLGIPFAAPPTGPLRWRTPQPVVAWDGLRPVTRFAPTPVQPAIPPNSLLAQFSFASPPESAQSEDCLYLNVWTPNEAAEPLPVIFFIYGGGHRVGGASHPVSDGARLAARGAVVVTANYRLGSLGYLAHPALTDEQGSCGNYAGHDLVAALVWVQRNIARFGGDAGCVTVFGQSAGAAHVTTLLASPLADGLFHRAIAHSGGRFDTGPTGSTPERAAAEAAGKTYFDSVGLEDLDAMRAAAADSDEIFGPRGMWNIIRDGRLLDRDVQTALESGARPRIPVLAGYNSEEATIMAPPDLLTAEGLTAHLHRAYENAFDEMAVLYPASSDNEAAASAYRLLRDSAFGYQPWKLVKTVSRTGGAFLYRFSRAIPLPDDVAYMQPRPRNGYGAYHGAELWHAFGNFDAMPWKWDAVDRELSDTMMRYWLNFARTGDPNGPDLPAWPSYRADGPNAVELDAGVRAIEVPEQNAFERFDERYRAASR